MNCNQCKKEDKDLSLKNGLCPECYTAYPIRFKSFDTKTAVGLEEYFDAKNVSRAEIRADRGKRYGSKDDVLGNVSTFGIMGAIVSATECGYRIRNKGMILMDIINRVTGGQDVKGWTEQEQKDFYGDLDNACDDNVNYTGFIQVLKDRK